MTGGLSERRVRVEILREALWVLNNLVMEGHEKIDEKLFLDLNIA